MPSLQKNGVYGGTTESVGFPNAQTIRTAFALVSACHIRHFFSPARLCVSCVRCNTAKAVCGVLVRLLCVSRTCRRLFHAPDFFPFRVNCPNFGGYAKRQKLQSVVQNSQSPTPCSFAMCLAQRARRSRHFI